MVILKLYKVFDETIVLNKTLINPIEINGNFRTEIDALNVVVEIESNTFDFNYVYCPELERYYFLDNIVHINSKLIRLYLHCDVLMTYKADILNSFGLVIQGNPINPYYSQYTKDCRTNRTRKYFNNALSDNSNIVVVSVTNGFEAN